MHLQWLNFMVFLLSFSVISIANRGDGLNRWRGVVWWGMEKTPVWDTSWVAMMATVAKVHQLATYIYSQWEQAQVPNA